MATTEQLLQLILKQHKNALDFFSQSAIEKFIEEQENKDPDHILTAFRDDFVWQENDKRICDYCGDIMDEGYLLDNYYACSDDCRNALYKSWIPTLETDEDAEKAYLFDYWCVYDIAFEDWLDMTLEECHNYDGIEGDNYFYTQWY